MQIIDELEPTFTCEGAGRAVANVFMGMKRENKPRKPIHPIYLRLGGSKLKLDIPTLRIVVVVVIVLTMVLLGKEVDAVTLKNLIRLVP